MLACLPVNAAAAPCATRSPTRSPMPLIAIAGSAFKPFAGIAREKLGIAEGRDQLMTFGDETGHDAHCKRCGSLLYSVVREGAYVHVAMGTLVGVPSIRPTAHIFVGSKAPWFAITDDLPQYEGNVVAAE